MDKSNEHATQSQDTGGARNDQDERDQGEFAQLFKESLRELEPGQVTTARVVEIRDEGVVVDIGFKSEAILPRSEFSEEEIAALDAGTIVDVFVVSIRESDDAVLLSKGRADRIRGWEEIETAFREGRAVEGRVVEHVKGGLTVDVDGLLAFLPASQADMRPVRDLDSLVGTVGAFKVIKLNAKRMNAVVSRRAILEEERTRLREKTVAELSEGTEIHGVVKNVTDYGVFVDLGGIDGLVHVSDLSWGRVGHPSEMFSPGDPIDVVVLDFDPVTEKVSLGYRQRFPDPWLTADERYSPGDVVRGTVVTLADYGAFVELEPGIEGLVHLSEMSWVEKVRHPSQHLARGEEVEVVVLGVQPDRRRISLSLKQTRPNPWALVEERYAPGQRIRGRVKNITDFGVFVTIPEGVDGLIHISDLSWTKHVRHPTEIVAPEQELEVVVLAVDASRERMSLGLKQLSPDPWEEGITNRFRPGDVVTGTVLKVVDFGVFVELEGGLEGLVFSSEIDEGDQPYLGERCCAGRSVSVRVLKVDPQERKIGLSMKGGLLKG